jgi:hypothetical protein
MPWLGEPDETPTSKVPTRGENAYVYLAHSQQVGKEKTADLRPTAQKEFVMSKFVSPNLPSI